MFAELVVLLDVGEVRAAGSRCPASWRSGRPARRTSPRRRRSRAGCPRRRSRPSSPCPGAAARSGRSRRSSDWSAVGFAEPPCEVGRILGFSIALWQLARVVLDRCSARTTRTPCRGAPGRLHEAFGSNMWSWSTKSLRVSPVVRDVRAGRGSPSRPACRRRCRMRVERSGAQPAMPCSCWLTNPSILPAVDVGTGVGRAVGSAEAEVLRGRGTGDAAAAHGIRARTDRPGRPPARGCRRRRGRCRSTCRTSGSPA